MPGDRRIYSSHVCNFDCLRIDEFQIPGQRGTADWFAVTTKVLGMQKAPSQQGLIISDKLFAFLRKRNYYTNPPFSKHFMVV
jgi:hypothetical protein